ncbi:hypothetical protein GE061_002676 [Apolygus lucorum]|uniref:Uncharacterized protein n=1 Tax=Apolygus lucorum TaxID=248454 RepID=A0A8S9X9V4_APOLU|nr:hypothetical protein GE061_002676 [Apolygus lucorum]
MADISRETGTGESVHSGSFKTSHAAKVAEHRMAASQGRYVFSSGILVLLIFSVFNRFSNFISEYYVRELFLKLTLMPKEAAKIGGYILTFYEFKMFIVFIPAIVVDNYIRREWVYYVMVSIGAFGSAVLCRLAAVSAQYYYFKDFSYKENLFVAYITLQSFDELSGPVFVSLVMDNIIHLDDFTAESSKIFSTFILTRECCRLGAFLIAIYTSTSKSAAANGQIVPPILLFSATIALIVVTNWKYPLISFPLSYNGIFKLTGSYIQRVGDFLAKKVCRIKHARKHDMCHYSEKTHEESKRCNNVLLIIMFLLMHNYSINVVAQGSFTGKILTDDPQELAIQRVYGQCMITAFMIFSQTVLFPLMYRTKMRRIVSSPLRCMATSYLVVWMCGVIMFVILCLNQRLEPGLFRSQTSREVSFYNMINDTVDLDLLNIHGGDTVPVAGYGKHSVVLDNEDNFLKIGVRNKKLLLDEYHEIYVNQTSKFLITTFGLDQIIIPPISGGKRHGNMIVVVCTMVVCRGQVKIDCDDQSNVVELHKFGEIYPVKVAKGARCKLFFQNDWVPESDKEDFQLVISEPLYYVAASEDMNQKVSLLKITKEPPLTVNLWTMLPIDLMCSWASMGRKQRDSETLAELATDVERLARGAFPDCPPEAIERIAVMPPDMMDKSVATDNYAQGEGEWKRVQLEWLLAALVDSKVVAMKADSSYMKFHQGKVKAHRLPLHHDLYHHRCRHKEKWKKSAMCKVHQWDDGSAMLVSCSKKLENEPSPSFEPLSPVKQPESAENLRVASLEARMASLQSTVASLVEAIQSSVQPSQIPDTLSVQQDDSDGDEGSTAESSDEEALDLWGRGSFTSPTDNVKSSFFDPLTAEKDPDILDPLPELSAQAIQCQRLGKPGWNRVRYLEAERRLKRSGVFQPLEMNPHFSNVAPASDYALWKQERLLASVTHGLLAQRKAFRKGCESLTTLCPGAAPFIDQCFLQENTDFRAESDALLQFTCGKRAEVLAARRKAVEPNDAQSRRRLRLIPPSTTHLFDDEALGFSFPPPWLFCMIWCSSTGNHNIYLLRFSARVSNHRADLDQLHSNPADVTNGVSCVVQQGHGRALRHVGHGGGRLRDREAQEAEKTAQRRPDVAAPAAHQQTQGGGPQRPAKKSALDDHHHRGLPSPHLHAPGGHHPPHGAHHRPNGSPSKRGVDELTEPPVYGLQWHFADGMILPTILTSG